MQMGGRPGPFHWMLSADEPNNFLPEDGLSRQLHRHVRAAHDCHEVRSPEPDPRPEPADRQANRQVCLLAVAGWSRSLCPGAGARHPCRAPERVQNPAIPMMLFEYGNRQRLN